MPKRILHVVTNVSHYREPSHRTGLWLSELTHAYEVFAAEGYEQQLVSPRGGASPLEPRSLKWPHADTPAKKWLTSESYQSLLANTARPDEIVSQNFDVIYFTGGHGVMFDFPDDRGLQRLTREIFERGGIVSSVCHGYCGLLNTELSNGTLLVAGRRLTGYSWVEEVLAGVAKEVPYNSEQEAKNRGALYEKGSYSICSQGRCRRPPSHRAESWFSEIYGRVRRNVTQSSFDLRFPATMSLNGPVL